jgi:hypothetical protein
MAKKKKKLNFETRTVIQHVTKMVEQCRDRLEIYLNLETLTLMITDEFYALIDWAAVIAAERAYWRG